MLSIASAVVTQMGIAQFSPTELRKVLAGKSASVTPRLGTISESLIGQCSAADIETMLQLTNLYFTQPRHDSRTCSNPLYPSNKRCIKIWRQIRNILSRTQF